jgi:hypothetical protein
MALSLRKQKLSTFQNCLKKIASCLLLLVSINFSTKAQTPLSAGDLAFTGYYSGGSVAAVNDTFSFVLLKTIVANTPIHFTDIGWVRTSSTTGSFQTVSSGTGEAEIEWSSTSGVAAGTEIVIADMYSSIGTVSWISRGISGQGLNLITSGDQIIAFTGTMSTPNFISAIHMNSYDASSSFSPTTAADWDGASNSINASGLPVGLTTGVNAIWIGSQPPAVEYDNARYNQCSLNLTTVSNVNTNVNNQSNWTTSNTATAGFIFPSGCPYLVASNPTVATTGTLTSFSTCFNSASAPQSFTVSGSDLTANLVVTAPSNFEVSLSAGSGYGTSLSLTPSSGTVASTIIYLRITSSAAVGSSTGNVVCGSTGATSVNVPVNGLVNALPSITNASQTNISCKNGNTGVATANSATGNGPFTYNWTPGNPTGDGTTSVTGLTAGIWTINVTDANGCTTALPFVITEPTIALNISASSSTNVSCFGGNNGTAIANTATGGNGSNTYNWTPGNPTGDGTTSVTGLSFGTYTCTVTDALSCSVSTTFSISQPTPLTFSTTITQALCTTQSGAITFNNGGGVGSYSVTPTYTQSMPAGANTFTLTDGNGCTATTTVTINPLPTATLTASNPTICSGNSSTLTASGNGAGTVDFLLSSPTYNSTNTLVVSPTAVNSASTNTYTVYVKDANQCTAQSTVIVTTNPTPSLGNTTHAVCSGNPWGINIPTATGAIINSIKIVSVSAPSGLSQISGSSIDLTNLPAAGYAYAVTASEKWSNTNSVANDVVYTMRAVSNAGCESADATFTTTIHPLPTLTLTNNTNNLVCSGQSSTITATATPVLSTYTVNTFTTNVVTPSTTTIYTVTGTTAFGCTNVANITIDAYTNIVRFNNVCYSTLDAAMQAAASSSNNVFDCYVQITNNDVITLNTGDIINCSSGLINMNKLINKGTINGPVTNEVNHTMGGNGTINGNFLNKGTFGPSIQ